METKTIASQPPSNSVAISTPHEVNYSEVVRTEAKRKADNGAQFTSTKGKTSLLLAVADNVRSQLGIAKRDEQNRLVPLPDAVFAKCKSAVEAFWHNEARNIVETAIANDAKLTVRRGVLMTRIAKGDKLIRSKTDKITSVYSPAKAEYKLCDTFGLTAAKNRLDFMLDNLSKFTREELNAQRHAIEVLENAVRNADK